MAGDLDQGGFERQRAAAEHALVAAEEAAGEDQVKAAAVSARRAAQLALRAFLQGARQTVWRRDIGGLAAAVEDAGVEIPGDVSAALARLEAAPDDTAGGDALARARTVLAFVDDAWAELTRGA